MQAVVFYLDKKFKKDADLIEKILNRLDKILELKGAYIEIYLMDGGFTIHSFEPLKNFPRPDIKGLKNLGEIHICPAQVNLEVRGGRWGGASYEKILVFLLIHGLLHLLGYDHKKDSDRIKMEREEWRLLKLLEK